MYMKASCNSVKLNLSELWFPGVGNGNGNYFTRVSMRKVFKNILLNTVPAMLFLT
jgi:hypothetical protein